MHRFLRYSTCKYTVTVKPGLGVIENDNIQSGTHDFLFTFHCNPRPITHHFRDKRRFPSKITNSAVYLTPLLKQFPLELGISAGVRRNENDGGYRTVYNVLR